MKKTNRQETAKFLLILLLFPCLFYCCNEPQEGCLDPSATNFDIVADNSCDDCCHYPQLTLTLKHSMNDTMLLQVDSHYINTYNQYYRIRDIKYFLTDFKFTTKAGTTVATILDTINLYNSNTTITLQDNFSLIKSNTREDTIGILTGTGAVDSLKLYMGIREPDSMWTATNGYMFNQIFLLKDTFEDTKPDTLFWGGQEEQLIEFSFPFRTEIIQSTNYNINLEVFYGVWFDDVDMENDTNEEIINKIMTNIPGSIQLL